MLFLINTLNPEELREIKETFEAIDTDRSGCISLKELEEAYQLLGHADVDIEELWKRLDYDKNGEVNYSEFLSGCIGMHYFSCPNKLMNAFRHFDVDESGEISMHDLRRSF